MRLYTSPVISFNSLISFGLAADKGELSSAGGDEAIIIHKPWPWQRYHLAFIGDAIASDLHVRVLFRAEHIEVQRDSNQCRQQAKLAEFFHILSNMVFNLLSSKRSLDANKFSPRSVDLGLASASGR
jgi:hypothetical protein